MWLTNWNMTFFEHIPRNQYFRMTWIWSSRFRTKSYQFLSDKFARPRPIHLCKGIRILLGPNWICIQTEDFDTGYKCPIFCLKIYRKYNQISSFCSNIDSKSLNNTFFKHHQNIFLLLFFLFPVFVYKAGAFTYFFCT